MILISCISLSHVACESPRPCYLTKQLGDAEEVTVPCKQSNYPRLKHVLDEQPATGKALLVKISTTANSQG